MLSYDDDDDHDLDYVHDHDHDHDDDDNDHDDDHDHPFGHNLKDSGQYVNFWPSHKYLLQLSDHGQWS